MSPRPEPEALHLTGDDAADALLSRDPFALLTGMLLDQQVAMEKAFSGPAVIAARLGTDRLDPAAVAAVDPDRFVEIMATPPAVHRYPASMAGRVQALAAYVAEHYAGDASALWTGAADGADLLRRLKALPGFGDQKARIFLALLGKRRGVRPAGWQNAAGDYAADGYRSVADVVDADSLLKVREYKRSVKAAAKAKAGASGG